MTRAELLAKVQGKFPEAQEVPSVDPKFVKGNDEPQLKVPKDKVAEIANFLKHDLGLDLLDYMTAVDYIKENRFEVIYNFTSTADPANAIFIKADVPREGAPSLPSITPVYAAADWQERETYDLFGIKFDGHPNHKRILLWEGFPGWPLRKDYVHTQDRWDNGQEIGIPKAPAAETAPKPA